MRKYSGGVHSDSPTRCIVIGTSISVIVPVIVNNIYISLQITIFMSIVILMFCYFIILKLSPVDSIAKPIVNVEMRKQLKNKALLTLFITIILLIILINLYMYYRYAILINVFQCVCFALLWQCFTLTTIGHTVMKNVDRILKYIIRR